ncbi:MAG: hypothetical protein ACRDD8_11405 [Bacteroidales bacterium]
MQNTARQVQESDISVFHELHRNSKATIQIAHINRGEAQWDGVVRRYETICKKYLPTLAEKYDNTDLYYSLNTFKHCSRKQENLVYLNALYIDIDYYKNNLSQEYVLGYIHNLVDQNQMPMPTFIVDSGRGLYAIWQIQGVPKQALQKWRRCMKYLYNLLEPVGADPACVEPTRIFRLNGSYHSQAKKIVQTISYVGTTHSLYHFEKEYLAAVPKPLEDPRGKPKAKPKLGNRSTFGYKGNKEILYLYNQYKVYEDRIQDLYKLAELRDYDLKPYHCRELMLFLTRYWTYCTTKDDRLAIEKTVALNLKFKDPLTEKEIVNSTRINDRAKRLKIYRYGNQRIIELLKISEEEQAQLKTLHTEKVRAKKRAKEQKQARRNEVGNTSRQQKKLDQEEKIKTLVARGLTTKEIALEIGLNVRSIQRIRKAMAI